MKKLAWMMFCQLAMLATAEAASFDCGKAASKVEKLICADASLSKLDEEMSAAYKAAMQGGSQPHLIRQAQKQWMQQRNGCADARCLTDAYTNRLAQMTSSDKAQPNQPPTALPTEDAKACREVAEHLNHNTLTDLLTLPVTNAPSREELNRIFGGAYSEGNYWTLDLNNDGIVDQLMVVDEGTAHFTTVYARSGRSGATPVTMGANDDEASGPGPQFDPLNSVDILAVAGRHYIFDGSVLWNLNKDGAFQAVCQLQPVGKPIVELMLGKATPVCQALLSSEKALQHVSYNLKHELGDQLPDDERLEALTPQPGIARVDINNDGNADNVVRLDYFFPGGRTCSATNIAVTDSSSTHIPDTKLNRLLLDELASHPCGPSLDVLVHNGVTYVDATYEGRYTLYCIKHDKAEKVCESRTHINVQAVGVRSGP